MAVYNAFWFAVPPAALVLARRRPLEFMDFLRRVMGWGVRREREILVVACGSPGIYLMIKGVVELLPWPWPIASPAQETGGVRSSVWSEISGIPCTG